MNKKYLFSIIAYLTLFVTTSVGATLMDFDTVVATTNAIANTQPIPVPTPLLLLGVSLLTVVAVTKRLESKNKV